MVGTRSAEQVKMHEFRHRNKRPVPKAREKKPRWSKEEHERFVEARNLAPGGGGGKGLCRSPRMCCFSARVFGVFVEGSTLFWWEGNTLFCFFGLPAPNFLLYAPCSFPPPSTTFLSFHRTKAVARYGRSWVAVARAVGTRDSSDACNYARAALNEDLSPRIPPPWETSPKKKRENDDDAHFDFFSRMYFQNTLAGAKEQDQPGESHRGAKEREKEFVYRQQASSIPD